MSDLKYHKLCSLEREVTSYDEYKVHNTPLVVIQTRTMFLWSFEHLDLWATNLTTFLQYLITCSPLFNLEDFFK